MPGDPSYKSAFWRRLCAIVARRSGGFCEVPGCKARGAVVDHVISRRKGGADHPDNLRHLCRRHDNEVKETSSGDRRNGGRLIVRGCDAAGMPLDPNHPWNRAKRTSDDDR